MVDTDSDFVETPTGSRISRQSTMCGASHIRVLGRSVIHAGAVLRGDLGNVRLGKSCVIGPGCVVRPAHNIVQGKSVFLSVSIGDNVLINEGSVVEASVIGSGVVVGKHCVIGARCVIKDCCWIKDGAVLAPDTVVAPFSIFEGCPAVYVGELPEAAPEMIRALVHAEYMRGR